MANSSSWTWPFHYTPVHCQYQQVTPRKTTVLFAFTIIIIVAAGAAAAVVAPRMPEVSRPNFQLATSSPWGVLMAIGQSWSEFAPWERVKISVSVSVFGFPAH